MFRFGLLYLLYVGFFISSLASFTVGIINTKSISRFIKKCGFSNRSNSFMYGMSSHTAAITITRAIMLMISVLAVWGFIYLFSFRCISFRCRYIVV